MYITIDRHEEVRKKCNKYIEVIRLKKEAIEGLDDGVESFSKSRDSIFGDADLIQKTKDKLKGKIVDYLDELFLMQ